MAKQIYVGLLSEQSMLTSQQELVFVPPVEQNSSTGYGGIP
jgi:hypothetical protein